MQLRVSLGKEKKEGVFAHSGLLLITVMEFLERILSVVGDLAQNILAVDI